MWVSKKELEKLSDFVRDRSVEQEDIRDNKEGALSRLKNDIYTLVDKQNEQLRYTEEQRDILSGYMADISHQLKTPITSMQIMADLLADAEPEKQEEFIHDIKVSLNKMEWLVSALLKMAKLDTDEIEFTKTQENVSTLLAPVKASVDILLDIHDQTLEIANDCRIMCDRRWTVEALTNLVKNGIEHSPDGGKIIIDCGENPLCYWISVTDSGEGMDRSHCAALFKRFEYSTNQNGYGIGLPLALSIAKGQGGDIDVDFGGNGRGATFTLKLFK